MAIVKYIWFWNGIKNPIVIFSATGLRAMVGIAAAIGGGINGRVASQTTEASNMVQITA